MLRLRLTKHTNDHRMTLDIQWMKWKVDLEIPSKEMTIRKDS